MANHLTPEELSKELGIDRQEVIRVCVDEGVPIYLAKNDPTLLLRLGDAPLQRLHQVDDGRFGYRLWLRDLLALQLRLEQLAQVAAVLARELRRIELADEAVHDLLRELELLRPDLRARDGLVDLGL